MTKKKNLGCPEIRKFKLSELKMSAYNPRTISPEAMGGLTASLERFGCVEPIVVNVKGGGRTIVGGHQRFKALQSSGQKEVMCVTVNLDKTEERLLNLSLNNPHIQGEFIEALDDYINELAGEIEQSDLIDLQIDKLSEELMAAPGPVEGEDDVPDPPKKPKTRTGDLWILGNHRLLCGDATKEDNVEHLIGGEKADIMATDPPYGVAYGVETGIGCKFKAISNDENDGEKLQAFLEACFRIAPLKNNAAWYLWHAQITQGFFAAAAAAAAAAAVIIHRQIIWVKPTLVLGRGDYHWRHELCFYGWKEGHRPKWYGGRKQTTVWEIGRENDHIHPTQKPVEIFEKPLTFNTRVGEIAYEPFSGSGSQLIACEKTNRICYGMEIDPAYCDVIVDRWQTFTGEKATRSKKGSKNG